MKKYKQLVADAGKEMVQKKLTIETWGNISYCDREKQEVYITPSGIACDKLTADDVVALGMDGAVKRGHLKPSIESDLHVALYKNRPDISAVVHTHPIYSCVFASMGKTIPLFHDEAAQVLRDDVKTAPYALPGSQQLAVNCADTMGDIGSACLLQSHGAVCIGETMEHTFRVAAVLEMVSEIYIHILSIGGDYLPLSPQDIDHMRHFAANEYGQ